MDAATKQEWTEKRAKEYCGFKQKAKCKPCDTSPAPQCRAWYGIAASDVTFFEALLDAEVERQVKEIFAAFEEYKNGYQEVVIGELHTPLPPCERPWYTALKSKYLSPKDAK